MFSCQFFKITKETFFIKYFRATSRLENSPWLLVEDIIFQPFKVSHFDSILIDLTMKCRNFIFKPFTKERRNSLEFLAILSLLSMYIFHVRHCWKGCKPLITICYLHDFFLCSFRILLALDEVVVEEISFDVRRSFLIVFLFLLNKNILIRKFEILRYFCEVCLCYA